MHLVERGAQLAELSARLNTGSANSGDFIVISGPTGCGKSALLTASAELLRGRNTRILSVGRATETGSPSVDVVSAVRELLTALTSDTQRGDVAALARRLADLARPEEPILLMVDDAHLIDSDSNKLLRELALLIETAPINIVLSGSRRITSHQDSWVPSSLLRLRKRKRKVVVEPLTRAGMTDLVQRRLGVRSAVPSLIDELVAVTGGNPALAHAVLDDVVGAGASGGPMFGSAFTQAVLSWLHAPACTQLVEAAQAISVLGTSCNWERLDRMVGTEPQRLRHIVDGLKASGVLSSELTLHQHIRDVLLKSMDSASLSRLQSRAAEVLYDDGAPAEEVARQLLANGSAPQPWAVAVLREAADQAIQSDRYQDAVSFLQRASRWCADDMTRLEVNAGLTEVGWWSTPAMDSRQLRSLLDSARKGCLPDRWTARLARRLAWMGRVDDADEILHLSLGAPHKELDARIEIAISDAWLAHLFPGTTRALPRTDHELPPEMFAGQYPWLSSAQELPRLLTAERREALQLRAEEILQQCRPSRSNLEAVQVALFSLLAAELQGSAKLWLTKLTVESEGENIPPQWRSTLHAAQAVVSWWQGDLTEAVDSAERALELLGAQQSEALTGLPRGVLLMAMTEQGRHEEVSDELLQPMPFPFTRSPYGLVYLRARGRHHLATGSLQAALADFRSCRDILGSWDMELPGLIPWRLDMSQTLLSIGEHKEARRLAEQHLSLYPDASSRSRGTALRLLAMASSPSRRAAALREAVTVLDRSGDSLELVRALGALSHTYQQTGQLAYGRRTWGRAEKIAQRRGALWALTDITTAVPPNRVSPEPLLQHAECPDLSTAERKVAELAVQGYTNREIAEALYITISTVEQHLTHIYRKLGIRGRSELGNLSVAS